MCSLDQFGEALRCYIF
uniref:Uncharacterized protein n=1 Tax=Anguilla anguilla TaxID=7936 RepID=A0A0E9PD93_ANGAN